MNTLKLIFKYTVLLTVMVGIGLAGYAIYVRWPSQTDIRLAEGPTEPLAELIAMAQAGVAVNPDLHAAATYRPGHPLYKALLAIQQKRWWEAAEELEPLVEQGDPDAMFWYGEITYSSSFSAEGGKWFVKAAELGNPYAAMKIAPKYTFTYDCERWLSRYCDDKWGEIGLKLLQQRADKGDVKAAYAYLYYTQFEDNSYEYLDKLIEVAKQGIEQHYYRPLRSLVYMYRDRRDLSPFKRDDKIPLSEQEKQQLAQILMIAINNNDLRAARQFYYFRLNKEAPLSDAYFNQAVQRMLPVADHTSGVLIYDYFAKEAPKHDRDFVIQGFVYTALFDFYYEDDGPILRTNRDAYFYFLEKHNIPPLSEQEQEQGLLLSEQYKEQATALLYIDEVRGTRRY